MSYFTICGQDHFEVGYPLITPVKRGNSAIKELLSDRGLVREESGQSIVIDIMPTYVPPSVPWRRPFQAPAPRGCLARPKVFVGWRSRISLNAMVPLSVLDLSVVTTATRPAAALRN